MRIVHLPCYDDNPYQRDLIHAQSELGHTAWEGGGGGNFIKIALFKWKADVVHFHWLHPYLLRESASSSFLRATRFLLEVFLLKVSGARIVWTIHNLQNHDKRHVSIERAFTKRFARMCAVCIAHSHEAARQAAAYFEIPPGRIEVIPHASYVGMYPQAVSRETARARLGLGAKMPVLLFLGRIHEYKGVFDLIDCFGKTTEPSRLVIAGEPADEATAKRLRKAAKADPRVVPHPQRVPDEELQTYFAAADLVVFPYRDILTSGAVVLAMSFGKAVVAPDKPSIRETVPAEGGTFFKPQDLESLSHAIRDALASDLSAAGAANLQRAQDWSWAKTAEHTLEVYRR